MIEFKGELAHKTMKHICKYNKISNLYIMLIVFAIMGVPVNILFICYTFKCKEVTYWYDDFKYVE
jgi:hypothetical protein